MKCAGNSIALCIVFALALVSAGCQASEEDGSGAAAGPQPAPVVLGDVREGTLDVEQVFFAEIRARHRAALSVSAAGEVTSIDVREGDRVREGDVLVAVDDSVAVAQLREANSALQQVQINREQAERDAERARRLAERSLRSGQEVEQLQAEVESLDAQAASLRASSRALRAQVSDHAIIAPFNGIVTNRYVDRGDYITPGTPALDLVGTDEVEAFVRIPQQILDRLDELDTITLRGTEGAVEADIAGVVGVLDPATRTGLIRVLPREVPAWLRPGRSVDAVVSLPVREPGFIVSQDAVVYGVARPRIILFDGGQARPVMVDVIATAGSEALVQGEGLSANQRVVIRGNERLRPQQPLREVSDEQMQEPGAPAAPRAVESEGATGEEEE